MFEQLTIFDVMQNEPVQDDIFQKAYNIFHETCRHRGWNKPATETEPSVWMCAFAGKQLARCWGDWIPCTAENCPLREK